MINVQLCWTENLAIYLVDISDFCCLINSLNLKTSTVKYHVTSGMTFY
jgi:hypothetical protein